MASFLNWRWDSQYPAFRVQTKQSHVQQPTNDFEEADWAESIPQFPSAPNKNVGVVDQHSLSIAEMMIATFIIAVCTAPLRHLSQECKPLLGALLPE